MWSTEHSVETSASPEAVWRLWSDMPRWPEWNADLSQAELEGEFSEGSTIRMTSNDGEAVELWIAEALESERFVDEADADTVGAEVGPRISGDFPEVLEELARRAER
jgi:uncharacterized protein YndB with AHSA1/START domain